MKKAVALLMLVALPCWADIIPETTFTCEVSDTSAANAFDWSMIRGEARYLKVQYRQYGTNMNFVGYTNAYMYIKASNSTNRYYMTCTTETTGVVRALWPTSNAAPAAVYVAEFGITSGSNINLAARGKIKLTDGTGSTVPTMPPWYILYTETDPIWSLVSNDVPRLSTGGNFLTRPTVSNVAVMLQGEVAPAAYSNITGDIYDNASASNALVAKQNAIAGTAVTNGANVSVLVNDKGYMDVATGNSNYVKITGGEYDSVDRWYFHVRDTELNVFSNAIELAAWGDGWGPKGWLISSNGIALYGTLNLNSQIVSNGYYQGNGSGLTYLNADNIASGTVSLARLPSEVITNGATFTGTVITATSFSGGGGSLTGVKADYAETANIASNLVAGYKPNAATNADFATYATTANNASNLAGLVASAYLTNNQSGAGLGQLVNTDGTNTAGNAYAEKDWVRSLVATRNTIVYNITNVFANTNYYIAAGTTGLTSQVRIYTAVTNNQYLGGGIITTSFFTQVQSPVTINAYLGFNTGAGRALTIKPEIYYTYDGGTNLAGDWDCGGQALISTQGLYTFTIPFPTYTATNSRGFQLVRRFKVVSQNNNPDAYVWGNGGATPGSFSFTSTFDSSLGTRGATNLTGFLPSVAYDSANRVLTMTNVATTNLNMNAYNVTNMATLGFTNGVTMNSTTLNGTNAMLFDGSLATNFYLLLATNPLTAATLSQNQTFTGTNTFGSVTASVITVTGAVNAASVTASVGMYSPVVSVTNLTASTGTFNSVTSSAYAGNGAGLTNLTTWACRVSDFNVTNQDLTSDMGLTADSALHVWNVSSIVTGPAKRVQIHMYGSGAPGNIAGLFSASNSASMTRDVLTFIGSGTNVYHTFTLNIGTNKLLYYYLNAAPSYFNATITDVMY